jgi:pyruvate,water dikinase
MPEDRPDSARGLRERHEALRDLLDRNGRLLDLMADIQVDLRLLVPADPIVQTRTLRLLEATLLQAQTLNILSENRHRSLYEAHTRIEAEIRRVLGEERRRLREDPLTKDLSSCCRVEQALAGGKAARLGELAARLPERVPPGFVITTAAYARFLAQGQTGTRLRELMKGVDPADDPARLRSLAARARDLVLDAPVPEEIVGEIRERAGAGGGAGPWAVRSSAVGEDGPFSFAGQFETVLHVAEPELPSAWRRVVASSFSEHVIRYRLACGLFELATPMAVLCMPMVAAGSSGVLYTRDPARPEDTSMLINAVRGLGPDLVGGVVDAETTFVSRDALTVRGPAAHDGDGEGLPDGGGTTGAGLSPGELVGLARLGLECEAVFDEPLDVEWAIGDDRQVFLLQARPLASRPVATKSRGKPTPACLARGGVTIVGGRVVGAVSIVETPDGAGNVPEGSILVVPQAAPELGHLLPTVDGLVAEHGSVAGHLASLAREFGVPSVFGMPEATRRLKSGQTVSLNATHGEVYPGEVWPREGQDERRQAREMRSGARSPLHPLVLRLDLTDPRAPSFRPKGCRSLHDIVRLCHERGIAALFEQAEWRQGAPQAGARRLHGVALPDGVWVLDAGGGVVRREDDDEELEPQHVRSRPFQALWRGMTAPGIAWSGRRVVDLRGLASVVTSSMTEAGRDADSLGGAAYLIVASDYVNFNARMAYHYAMVDSLVGETPESNYVSFRFWGGGAGLAQRDMRALFLAEVLARAGFGVERRGDLVTARMQRYAGPDSERGLEVLGKLMGCARQLDMLLHSEAAVAKYVNHFLDGEYEEFA